MEVLTPSEMNRADALTIEGGKPGFDLMQAAAKAVAEGAVQISPEGRRVLVLAGPGNNGGDGFVAAKILRGMGRDVTVCLLGDANKLEGDAKLACESWDGPLTPFSPELLQEAELVIDALFGAGLARPITGEASEWIDRVNTAEVPVLAVDLPSGVDGETGQVLGTAIKANASITFFRKKPGHLLYPGRELSGWLVVVEIGIEEDVLDKIEPLAFENDRELWIEEYPDLDHETHKYQRGHAVVVSGLMHATGAARLAAKGALRSGAGLVTVASPRDALSVNAHHLTAIMLKVAENGPQLAEILSDPRVTSLVIGPGCGVGALTWEKVLAGLNAPAACVLDADALTSFNDHRQTLFTGIQNAERPPVMTPHEGEFKRLFPDVVSDSKLERARMAAKMSGAIVVLKGPDTVIAAPDGRAAINANGPPWLATAGSGDVLAGTIGGLLAQGMPSFKAACAGVWLHGQAGLLLGPHLTADDLDAGLWEACRFVLN